MELVVGTNSYVTLDEANELINSRFMDTDPIRKTWDNLSDDNKKILIISTTEKYDNSNLLYKGYKIVNTQLLEFPRRDNYNKLIECPVKIKVGLLVQGIKEIIAQSSEEEQLQNMGVHSFSDGSGASVTFESDNNKKLKNNKGFYNDVWHTYFAEYSYLV